MFEKIIERLESENKNVVNIGLFTHQGCDYDAVCSTLTLGNFIKERFGAKVNVYPILDVFNFKIDIHSDLPVYHIHKNIELDYGVVLDVNEQDRIYGLELFNTVALENRFLFDHHAGNRNELEVLENQKLVIPRASSTCEIIAKELLADSMIDEHNSYNLYLGIASDTAGFTRQVSEVTNNIVELLNIDKELREQLVTSIVSLTPLQEELYNSIIKEESEFTNLKLYRLRLNDDEIDKVKELKNKFIEEKITPKELDVVSVLIIECGQAVLLKIRKNENSDLDILSIAEKCNGGGHCNRCSGRFYDTTYEEVLTYFKQIYNENFNDDVKVKYKKV